MFTYNKVNECHEPGPGSSSPSSNCASTYLSLLTLILGKWNRLMMEEKGKEWEILMQISQGGCNSWGKEGM
jgi:hypothetical protein